MRTGAPRPPRLLTRLLGLWRLGSRRAEIEADLAELFADRVAARGQWHARWRYLADVLSVGWRFPRERHLIAHRRAMPSQSLAAFRPLRRAWLADLHHAWRTVRRDARHSVAIATCIGFGVAASLVTVTVLNAVLFGKIPGVVDRSTLYQVHVSQAAGRLGSVFRQITASQFRWLAARAEPLVLAAEGVETLAARIGDEVRPVTVAFVSSHYFDLLGTQPAAGRLLGAGDDGPDRFPAVVSQRFRTTHLGASWQEVLTVSGQQVAIVGVAEADFVGAGFRSALHEEFSPIDIWIPLSAAPAWSFAAESPEDLALDVVLRLPTGASAAAVRARLQAVAAGMPVEDTFLTATPEPPAPRGVQLARLGHPRSSTPESMALLAAGLMAAPLVVLAIACANAANLRLAKASARARDFAVRLSLGASRGQLIRLLCVESLLLAGAATIVGWLAAGATLKVFTAFVLLPVALDWRIALFTAVLILGAALLFGMAPAVAATTRLMRTGLRLSAREGGRSHARFRQLMVGAQVALSIGLLVIAALFARTLERQVGARPVIADEILVTDVDLSKLQYGGPASARFATDLAARAVSDRRVTAVGLSDQSLIPGSTNQSILRPGETRPQVRPPDLVHVTPGWFEVFGLRPTTGRLFGAGAEPATVAVVDEDLARHIASDGLVVGMPLRLPHPDRRGAVRALDIAGVVPNGIHRLRPRRGDARLYVSLGPQLLHGGQFPPRFTLFVRTLRPAEVGRDLGRLITELEPRGVSFQTDTARALLEGDDELRLARWGAMGVGAAGLLALLLAAAGIYTTVTYNVSLQSREIGIRLAIGAQPGDTVRLIVRRAMTTVSAGVLAGIAIALVVGRTFQSQFAGISSFDPLSIAGTSAVLIAVAGLAALVPARRAARVDPVQVLRAE